MVACGNAAGNVLPPLIIFDTKHVQHSWTKGEVPGTKYGTSDKGWINIDLFESWFNDLFLPMQWLLALSYCCLMATVVIINLMLLIWLYRMMF